MTVWRPLSSNKNVWQHFFITYHYVINYHTKNQTLKNDVILLFFLHFQRPPTRRCSNARPPDDGFRYRLYI